MFKIQITKTTMINACYKVDTLGDFFSMDCSINIYLVCITNVKERENINDLIENQFQFGCGCQTSNAGLPLQIRQLFFERSLINYYPSLTIRATVSVHVFNDRLYYSRPQPVRFYVM